MGAKYLPVLLACLAQASIACSINISTDVNFAMNSAEISSEQQKKLALWVADIKRKSLVDDYIAMGASADVSEIDAEHLGRMRELAVRLALIDLGLTPRSVFPANKVYIVRAGAYGLNKEDDVKRVEIDYYPRLPCSCGKCK